MFAIPMNLASEHPAIFAVYHRFFTFGTDRASEPDNLFDCLRNFPNSQIIPETNVDQRWLKNTGA